VHRAARIPQRAQGAILHHVEAEEWLLAAVLSCATFLMIGAFIWLRAVRNRTKPRGADRIPADSPPRQPRGFRMPGHKFAVGEVVQFSPDRGQDLKAGHFEIIRLLPEAAGGLLQYKVKSQLDGHERVVREDQLSNL
jgi:hypothetical protein